MAMNVKKGDTVVVLSGKDKGKQGKVLTLVAKRKGVFQRTQGLRKITFDFNI